MPFDPSNVSQLASLKNELLTDPRSYGYAEHVASGAHNVLAELLDRVRTGSNGGPAIVINKGYLTPDELSSGIVYSEYNAGGTGANIGRQYVDMLMTLPRISVEEGSNPRNGLLAIFAAGTVTRANLIAAAQRQGSRMEELYGRDSRASADAVSRALAS